MNKAGRLYDHSFPDEELEFGSDATMVHHEVAPIERIYSSEIPMERIFHCDMEPCFTRWSVNS